MDYASLSNDRLFNVVCSCADKILPGSHNQEYLVTTVSDLIYTLSSLSVLQLEEVSELAFEFEKQIEAVNRQSSEYIGNFRNSLIDLLAPNNQVILIVNKKGFFSNIYNAVGPLIADDIIRSFLCSDFVSEVVFLAIYPDRNKFRFYGFWSPIAMSISVCVLALLQKNICPTKFELLVNKGIRIDEEIVIDDVFGLKDATANKLSSDSVAH